MLFDVSNPASPVQIGLLNTGCCTRGVHELEFEHRADLGTNVRLRVGADERVRGAGLAERVPRRAGPGRLPAHRRDESRRAGGGVRLGRHPRRGRAAQPGTGLRPDPVYGHSVEPSADGKLAFVSYWDSGFVALDVTNPASPDAQGPHGVRDGRGRRRALVHVRRCPSAALLGRRGLRQELRARRSSRATGTCGSGTTRTSRRRGRSASTGRRTPAVGLPVGSGDYTIHNPMLMGTDVYISWYSDGVRVVDASDPTNPEEVAYFVPPAGQNPVKPAQRANALPDAAGLGRLRGRGDRARLRERHEHRPLDPPPDRLTGEEGERYERRPPGAARRLAAARPRCHPERVIFRCRTAGFRGGRGVCADTGSKFRTTDTEAKPHEVPTPPSPRDRARGCTQPRRWNQEARGDRWPCSWPSSHGARSAARRWPPMSAPGIEPTRPPRRRPMRQPSQARRA